MDMEWQIGELQEIIFGCLAQVGLLLDEYAEKLLTFLLFVPHRF